jgi:DDE superfamily endonuclease
LDTLQEEGFTVVSIDESFFFYDSLVRKVWIKKDERPVVRITGSHQESVLLGATSLKGKQLFRQYDWFDANIFLDYLKQIHRKFPKCYLFLDKAKQQHHRSKKVLQYFDLHKNDLIPVYLPTASPEFIRYWNKYGI